jgi:type IV secretion system protein TrbL
MKSLAFGFLYALIVNAPMWFSAIIQGFQQIGGQAAGIPDLSPSTVFNNGLAMFQTIYRGFGSLGWFHLTIASLIALVAGLIMFLSFALIAGQMLLALSEAYIGVGGGVLILGFSGSRWTIKFAEGFLGWIVGVGIKLFFLYLLVGVGMTIIAGWNAALTGWTVADPTLPLTIAGGALIFMLLAWTIPNTAASVVGGAVSLNLSHAFEAAMAGYGLGRILTRQNAAGAESGASSQGGNSLGASLEAGDRAATNGARSASTHPTVQMPSSLRASSSASPSGNQTAGLARGPATQQAKHTAQTSLL